MQDGRALLWYTVNYGSKEVMEVLLNHAANVDSPDKVLLSPCPPIFTAPAERRLLVAEPAWYAAMDAAMLCVPGGGGVWRSEEGSAT